MNFLAHFYLSGDDEKLLVGNFIADAVKGKQHEAFEPEIQRGILLHRAIDHFTDTHPVVMESKKRLRPEFRHYAPVIVDVFYDHFLARYWNEYHHLSLSLYVTEIYAALQKQEVVFPERMKMILPAMMRYDWLNAYREVEGLHSILTQMASRAKYDSGMERAAKALERDYLHYESEFRLFFPELRDHVAGFLNHP
ncbi:MAG: acyl carrier protein phosphodiesterase [Bacteroidia bacterium]